PEPVSGIDLSIPRLSYRWSVDDPRRMCPAGKHTSRLKNLQPRAGFSYQILTILPTPRSSARFPSHLLFAQYSNTGNHRGTAMLWQRSHRGTFSKDITPFFKGDWIRLSDHTIVWNALLMYPARIRQVSFARPVRQPLF